jgi:hypothetical protein
MLLRISLFVTAALLLGAHFLRAGNLLLVALRQRTGQPWTLAAIILGSVALFSLLAGLLLNSRAIRERYPY